MTKKSSTPKDETPAPSKEIGVSGEQLSLLPAPVFCPILPKHGSAAGTALYDLMARDLTQPDWLLSGKGWRLAAAVKELDYLGWQPVSIMVQHPGWRNKIARYSLPQKAKQALASMRQQGDSL